VTVAIVALPLSMAIAIASGATPAQGLYTAIIGGFLVSAVGGSRFQVGGPASLKLRTRRTGCGQWTIFPLKKHDFGPILIEVLGYHSNPRRRSWQSRS